ncbi:hypothetical protein CDL15_Pgr015749 [Punica granatum]|uniref:Uncharacterized protein n=1 Tax=Punica granatum TaxID=22663 RepID=A0A218XP33_PUNGR|nr:hypothetical protein CDL15_Pgr015749 [Punica granatum]
MLVSGTSIPVAPYIGLELCQDLVNGMSVMVIKLDGPVRWRLGAFVKGEYHITVECPASLTFGASSTGIPIGNDAIKYQVLQSCDVNFNRHLSEQFVRQKSNSVLWLEWPEGQHCEDGGENRRRSGCEKKAKRASERAHECQEGTKQPW